MKLLEFNMSSKKLCNYIQQALPFLFMPDSKVSLTANYWYITVTIKNTTTPNVQILKTNNHDALDRVCNFYTFYYETNSNKQPYYYKSTLILWVNNMKDLDKLIGLILFNRYRFK